MFRLETVKTKVKRSKSLITIANDNKLLIVAILSPDTSSRCIRTDFNQTIVDQFSKFRSS